MGHGEVRPRAHLVKKTSYSIITIIITMLYGISIGLNSFQTILRGFSNSMGIRSYVALNFYQAVCDQPEH